MSHSDFTQTDMLPFKIDESFMDNRIILIMEEFTPSLAKTVVSKIMYFDSLNDDDITIYISSYGGMVDSLLSIIDAMEMAKSKVNVYCVGVCASAAAVLLACATGKRKAYKHGSIMIHEISAGTFGKYTDMMIDLKHSEALQKILFDMLMEHTKLTKADLEKIGSKDTWFTAQEALDAGIIDEILVKK